MAAGRQKKTCNDDKPAIWAAYGKLVKLFRDRSGFTQQALADAVGYSYEQVASIEQGRRRRSSPSRTRRTGRWGRVGC
ncbi:helix-turn-helix transcriptional regulator [Streptomyces sp. NPDC003023]|uniref:helix-turn-helix transcriptional regulator n=1 Tax=Streptomyces sp. NPDC003023 TaxID=3364675 RepID=UPI00368D57B8